jgi:hypothetical protein
MSISGGFSAPNEVVRWVWFEEARSTVDRMVSSNESVTSPSIVEVFGQPTKVLPRDIVWMSRFSTEVTCGDLEQKTRYSTGPFEFDGDERTLGLDELRELSLARTYQASELARAQRTAYSVSSAADADQVRDLLQRTDGSAYVYAVEDLLGHGDIGVSHSAVFFFDVEGRFELLVYQQLVPGYFSE